MWIIDWGVISRLTPRRYFRDQPLLHPSVTNERLLVWHFEDWLKKYFFSILQILEVRRSHICLRRRLTSYQDTVPGSSALCTDANDQSHIHSSPRQTRAGAKSVASPREQAGGHGKDTLFACLIPPPPAIANTSVHEIRHCARDNCIGTKTYNRSIHFVYSDARQAYPFLGC